MKKILLITLLFINYFTIAQVSFLIDNCDSYELTWTDSDFWEGSGGSPTWSTPNMVIVGNAISAPLVLVEGADPVLQGNCTFDLACNGVSSLTNSAALNGNIAVIMRGGCEFSGKALAAQNAGAIGCIIVNTSGNPIAMGGGTDGLNVTIPTIMVGENTGDAICDAINNGGANGFIGNINGYYANNLSVNAKESYQNNRAGDVAKLYNSVNATGVDHTFNPGILIKNLGTNNQTNIQILAEIVSNSSTVYSQTSPAINLNSGDSLWVDFPAFINSTETDATFNVQFQIISSVIDDVDCDNSASTSFYIASNKFSLAGIDPLTNEVKANSGFFGNTTYDSMKVCNHFSDANAEFLYPESISFQAYTTNSFTTTELTGRLVEVQMIEWTSNNGIYDITDPNFILSNANNDFTILSKGVFFYGGDYQDSIITTSFDTQMALVNNKHYLFCTTHYSNSNYDFSFRFDNTTDYSSNFGDGGYSPTINNGYPTTAVFINDAFYPAGYGLDVPSSMVVNFSDCLPPTGTEVVTACDSYTWIDGATYLGSTNAPTYTIVGGAASGCDSIAKLDLTILDGGFSVDVITSCTPYTWIDGNTYSSSTISPFYTIPNGSANGCDSTVYLDLTITGPSVTTNIYNGVIQAEPGLDSYQWVDCNDNYSVLVGETNQNFTPTTNGSYAVIVENPNCADTSNCVLVDYIGLNELSMPVFNLFPNPTNNSFSIQTDNHLNEQFDVAIKDLQGKEILNIKTTAHELIDIKDLDSGVYLVYISSKNGVVTKKLIVN